jgi:hypothetical protein
MVQGEVMDINSEISEVQPGIEYTGKINFDEHAFDITILFPQPLAELTILKFRDTPGHQLVQFNVAKPGGKDKFTLNEKMNVLLYDLIGEHILKHFFVPEPELSEVLASLLNALRASICGNSEDQCAKCDGKSACPAAKKESASEKSSSEKKFAFTQSAGANKKKVTQLLIENGMIKAPNAQAQPV